jgi:hypothetical protein
VLERSGRGPAAIRQWPIPHSQQSPSPDEDKSELSDGPLPNLAKVPPVRGRALGPTSHVRHAISFSFRGFLLYLISRVLICLMLAHMDKCASALIFDPKIPVRATSIDATHPPTVVSIALPTSKKKSMRVKFSRLHVGDAPRQ